MTMSSRTLINLLLLLTVGVLAAVAIYEPGTEEAPPAARLTALTAGEVRQLRIERQEGETVLLQRHDGGWSLTAPIAAPAREYRVDAVARVVEAESLNRFEARAGELASYGLEPPGATLTVNDAITLAFGTTSPLDQRRYVQVGDTVHLIEDTHYYRLIGRYATFLSSRLLPEGASLTALQLPNLTVRAEQGRWVAEPPPEGYSADAATALLDGWRYASAIEVKPYDGRGGEEVRLTLAGESEPVRFLVTARAPDLVLARPDLRVQYHLAAASAAELLSLPAPSGD